ncbi:translocation/assembly module TamB domain-containing protein [Alcaligenaceae bacterium A4P071]|nr:translocation/assembly module TamB domain-containing protein [Alcaligenaceae bacterium A4P071]
MVLLLAVVLGFAFWAMGTQTGTRILLTTAASQLDGEAVGVSGTLLDGVSAQRLAIKLPGVDVAIDDLNLVVDWKALNARRVHVRALSAKTLTVALSDTDKPAEEDTASSGPLSLPVDIAVDRLAIDQFNFTQNGQPLPVALSRLQATLAANGNGAQLRVNSLHIDHPIAKTDLQAEVNLASLNDPYPFEARLIAAATGIGADSPLCLDQYLDPAGRALARDKDGKPIKAGAHAIDGKTVEGKPAVKSNPAAGKSAATGKAATAKPATTKAAAGNPAATGKSATGKPAKAAAQSPRDRYRAMTATAAVYDAALIAQPIAQVPGQAAGSDGAPSATAATGASCPAVVTVHANGSLDALTVKLDGEGSGLTLAANADLTPRGLFPLRRADAAVNLADGSGLTAQVDWTTEQMEGFVRDVLKGTVATRRLDVARLAGGAMPQALLTTDLAFSAELRDQSTLQRAQVDLTVAEGSRWNKQPLAGKVAARVATDALAAPAAAGQAQSAEAEALAGFRIDNVDIDLKLGPNKVQAQGSLGATESAITLAATAPRLDAFWPDLPGGADLKAKLAGTIAAHQGELTARYTPANVRENALGRARADAALAFSGGWGKGAGTDAQAALVGWRGQLSKLTASHAGFDLGIARQIEVAFLPDAQAPQWQWQVGAAEVGIGFPNKQRMTLAHAGSRGGAGRWETAGRIDNAIVSPALVESIMRAVDPDAAQQAARERGRVNARPSDAARSIGLDASWDLKFANALSGKARIARRNGDVMIPGDPPIPLNLQALDVDLVAKPTSGAGSRVDATINVATAKMGTVKGNASAMLNGLALDEKQPLRAKLDANIADLAWVSLFTGDSIELGGAVTASIDTQGTLAGPWRTTGTIRGSKLRVIRIDDGVRLFDGTLSARLEDNTVILDSLRFPASLRVMPDEWRTRTWITENEGAKGGYIEAKGRWNLVESVGNVRVDVHRFPALQRSDRYAMISGVLNIDAALPRVTITGDLTADAGWVSLEILQSVPSLDDDVRVVRPGTQTTASAGGTPMQMSMNLKFDMGPRFYITGMGLDAGLIGNIQIVMDDGRLSGVGALRTRGGRIEAYGQKLQLRRGTLTFQGALDNPILDIEALRTGEQVEAGVRVVGTAQRPRIDLVSYPDVDDVEKLSWLILGRGPDESGADTALLLSVGTALLGGGEPFYRRFGLDDVSVRSGAIGSSGSLLPDRTVAGNVNRDSDSDLATQFLVASKKFANGITLSVEQAMAGSETVGRASYALSRRLSVDLKGGSVNGLSLIYRTFFNE